MANIFAFMSHAFHNLINLNSNIKARIVARHSTKNFIHGRELRVIWDAINISEAIF